jgi:pimeloyl-ACP methyl ester carboxylesterase
MLERIAFTMDKQQEPPYAELQALVKHYRPIEELIPAQWSEGDVFAHGIRQHYYRTGNGERPSLLLWLERLKTLNHEERLVATLPILAPATGGRLWPEEEYVPEVEGYVLFDLDLVRDNSPLWTPQVQDNPAELLKRISCPALIMQHSFAFPTPGTQPTFREVPSEQPNIRIVYFENTGHLIRHVTFDQYMTLVRAFLKEH